MSSTSKPTENPREHKGRQPPRWWSNTAWTKACTSPDYQGQDQRLSCNWEGFTLWLSDTPCKSCAEERGQWQKARSSGDFYQQPHHPECPRCGIAESKVAYANSRDPGKAYHKQCAGFDPATDTPWTEADRREHFARRYARKQDTLTDKQIEAAAALEYPDDAVTGLADRRIFEYAAKWARRHYEGDDLATPAQQREAVKGEGRHEITGAELVGENVVIMRGNIATWLTVPASMLAQPVLEWDAQRGAGGHAGMQQAAAELLDECAMPGSEGWKWLQRANGREATCESCPAWRRVDCVATNAGEKPRTEGVCRAGPQLIHKSSDDWCMRHPRRKWGTV